MADVDPNCPRCSGPVLPDWDWCERCGYDPEGLKPVGWSPAPPPEPEPTKRRRSHRNKAASRTKVNAMAGAAAPAESWPSPIARFSPEPTRPPAPEPAVARAATPAPAVVAPRPPAVATPGLPTVTAAIDLRTPAPPASRRELRRIRPASRETAVPAPASASAPAPVAARPPATSGTTVFDLPPSRLELGLAGLLGVGAVAMAYAGLSSAPSIAAGSVLNGLATGVFILICLGIAGLLGFQAYALIKVRVVVDSRELVAKNRLGRPRRVPLDEIFSVTPTTRHYDIGFGISRTAEMPYVQVSDGAGFWIDALAGRDGEDPTPDQQAVLRQIAQIVARHRVVPVLPDLPS